MKTARARRRWLMGLLAALGLLALPLGLLGVVGWPASRHPVVPAGLGVARSTQALEAVLAQPGPLEVETVVAADWQVDRSGLINLQHPTARAAGLKDGPEPIQIYFHVLRHPTRGLFLVDSGVERALVHDPARAAVRGLVAKLGGVSALRTRVDTASWLAGQREPLAGVLLTHLHLDHVMGLPDVPSQVPIYAGPGETTARGAFHLATQATIDRALAGHGPIREWAFARDPSGAFEGVLDVFGDGSLWALSVPGHTAGSTAYLARTPNGPVLLVGDACHTAWGWEHGVEPGTFTEKAPESVVSFSRLRALVERHPEIDVRLGHQALTRPESRVSATRSAE